MGASIGPYTIPQGHILSPKFIGWMIMILKTNTNEQFFAAVLTSIFSMYLNSKPHYTKLSGEIVFLVTGAQLRIKYYDLSNLW